MTSGAELIRAHWERGEPGRAAPRELVLRLYHLWFMALVFKSLGAAWDMSWHFKWLRDDLAPPHLLNTVGTVIVLGLVIFHTYTGIGVDRSTLRWMQWGIGTFLVAAPLDVINHRLNGLDITAWSPSHALLYLGTGMMLVGTLRGWMHHGAGVPYFRSMQYFLWICVLDGFLFLNQHQEYGVLGLAAWEHGRPYAEPSLLQFAANQIGHPVDYLAVRNFTLPVPDWVYPSWAAVTTMVTLVLARRFVGHRWTATIVTSGYLAFRCVAWGLLAAAKFPMSTVPFFLLGGALVVDLSFHLPLPRYMRAAVGAILVTAATYVSLLEQATHLAAPPVDYSSVFYAAALLALLWAAVVYLTDSEHGRRTLRRIVAQGARSSRPSEDPPRATPLPG